MKVIKHKFILITNKCNVTTTMNLKTLLLSFLLLTTLLTSTNADVEYIVTNNAPDTPGGQRFEAELGVNLTLGLMGTINTFIWKVFEQPCEDTRKPVPVLNLFVSDFDWAAGYTNGDNINISAPDIEHMPPQTSFWFTSLLVHEMTHIFQWSRQGTAPGGLTEGVADYMMIQSKYYEPDTYTKPGAGGRWDEGYGVTARFLEYCDSLSPGFTVALNNMMRDVYHDSYFMDLLGKPLPQVWEEYKAKYGNIPADAHDALPHHVRLGLKL